MPSSSSFQLDRLRAGVKPFRLHWFPRLRSTNDHAAALRKSGALYAPAIVLTGHQTAGRGRGSNTWWSNGGVLTVTFVFPIDAARDPHELPLLAGLAVRNAAAELTGDPAVQLKWPNDVYHDGRKLAGLLCERVHKADLVGVGVNVNLDPADAPSPIRPTVTSLLSVAGRPLDMTETLSRLAQHLRGTLQRRAETPFRAFVGEYERHHWLTGKNVKVVNAINDPPVSGRCEGVDADGRLVLRSRGQVHRVIAGHVVVAADNA